MTLSPTELERQFIDASYKHIIPPDIQINAAHAITSYQQFLAIINDLRLRRWSISYTHKVHDDATVDITHWHLYKEDQLIHTIPTKPFKVTPIQEETDFDHK